MIIKKIFQFCLYQSNNHWNIDSYYFDDKQWPKSIPI
jgi:hypothetical protein